MEEGVAGKAETQTVLVNEHLIQCHSLNEAVQQGALKSHSPWGFPLASLVAQMVKNLPAMQETQVRSLGQDDPREKPMATHSVLLPGESRGQRILVGYSPWGCKESNMTEVTKYEHSL